jgi:hypothetical protein
MCKRPLDLSGRDFNVKTSGLVTPGGYSNGDLQTPLFGEEPSGVQ